MIRNGIYCLYKGKEYRFVQKAAGTYEIVTKDKSKIDESFDFYQNEVYRKQVDLDDIDEIYSINSFAVYNGDIFAVIRSVGDDLELTTSNIELAEENKMKTIGKNEFSKVVSKSEVDMFEEKKPLNLG